jgi:hypothetical protein
MTPQLKLLMLECGYAEPHLATRAHKLAELIVQRCISEVALMGTTHYENEDIMWCCSVTINNLKQLFKDNDE